MSILSPVWGRLCAEPTLVSMYIHSNEEVDVVRTIYAPISGRVTLIDAGEGTLTRVRERQVYGSAIKTAGKVWVKIDSLACEEGSSAPVVENVSFWIQAETPYTVSTKAHMYVETGDQVEAGDYIGDIIPCGDTFVEIYIPKETKVVARYLKNPPNREAGALRGGHTPIAIYET